MASKRLRTFGFLAVLFRVLTDPIIEAGASQDASKVLGFVAAQQVETAAVYDTLSYKAVQNSAVLEDFSPELFRQTVVFQVSRRSKSWQLTREGSHIIEEIERQVNGVVLEPEYRVRAMPTVKRLLITENLAVRWADVATPRLDLFRAKDWMTSEKGYQQGLQRYGAAVDLKARCLGLANPFHELFPETPSYASWASRELEDGTLEIVRTLRLQSGEDLLDLTLVIDPKDGLVQRGFFNTNDGFESRCEIKYQTFAYRGRTIRVPKEYTRVETDGAGKVLEDSRIEYSGFQDEEEKVPFTLKDLGIPEGAEVWCAITPSEVQLMQWKGGELVDLVAQD